MKLLSVVLLVAAIAYVVASVAEANQSNDLAQVDHEIAVSRLLSI